MSIAINTNTHLDERYSGKVIETLRSNTFLIPGATYNADYQGDAENAISVYFHKPSVGSVTAGAVGGDYSAGEFADTIVACNIANAFRESKKLRGIAADSVAFDTAAVYFKEAAEDIREGRDKAAIAALVYESTTSSSTTAITSSNVKEAILECITAAKKNKARPDTLLASPDTIAAIVLNSTNGSVFTPETNEEMLAAGSLGKIYGCSVFENQEVGASSNTAVPLNTAIGTAVVGGVDLSDVAFVVYDHRYFGMINHLTDSRIVEAQGFAGSLVNLEDNVGYKVLDAKAVIARKVASTTAGG